MLQPLDFINRAVFRFGETLAKGWFEAIPSLLFGIGHSAYVQACIAMVSGSKTRVRASGSLAGFPSFSGFG